MLELGDNGTSSHLWEYEIGQLPLPFQFLDIWTYFHLAVPAPIDFLGYETEYSSIHCKPSEEHTPTWFTPVYVETNPMASSIHCMLTSLSFSFLAHSHSISQGY